MDERQPNPEDNDEEMEFDSPEEALAYFVAMGLIRLEETKH